MCGDVICELHKDVGPQRRRRDPDNIGEISRVGSREDRLDDVFAGGHFGRRKRPHRNHRNHDRLDADTHALSHGEGHDPGQGEGQPQGKSLTEGKQHQCLAVLQEMRWHNR